MGKFRLLRIFMTVNAVSMILFIIIILNDLRGSDFYLHSIISRPSRLSSHSHSHFEKKAHEDKESSVLKDIDAFVNQVLEGITDPVEHPRQEWKIQLTSAAPELKQRQENRKQMIQDFCSNKSLVDFPGKSRTFDDIPDRELNHFIVDDKHRIIYCYVPKVACTNWKRIMIVLSESLPLDGLPYQDPMDFPHALIHNSSLHFTFDKFQKRYGTISRYLMKIKLKTYTKFLFVRDPFVRLISAYRNKLEQPADYFYKRFAVVMLKKYANYSNPPDSVVDAFAAGIRPSFANFIQFLLDPETEKEKPFDEHWQQMHRLCHPCQINYDFVGKLETVDEDAQHLLQILRLDGVVEFPPSYPNQTHSSWEREWFANIPLESRKELYKLYEADFKLFGYSKPDKLLHE